MKTTAPKRGRGRPRNPALDALQAELAVSRRRASSVLKEVKSSKPTTSENSMPALSPLAAARLEKLQKEIQFLETRIKTALMEQDALDRRLVAVDEARELLNRALEPVVQALRILPKSLSIRLVHGTARTIENTLADESNRILKMARENVARYRTALDTKP
jgi:chromosome segregation ATPase